MPKMEEDHSNLLKVNEGISKGTELAQAAAAGHPMAFTAIHIRI